MIQAIATDMDGTFLRDDKTFDEARFKRILTALDKRKIKLIIASGNQYRQLRLNFPGYDHHFAYVAENGAHIVAGGQTVFENFIDFQTVLACLKFLQKIQPQALHTVAGKESAYMLRDSDSDLVNLLRHYLPEIQLLESFDQLPEDDSIFKLTSLVAEEETQAVREEISQQFANQGLTGTSSGFGCIDIIQKGMHKGKGLSRLLDYWGMKPENLMAFGDGGNDIEILGLVGHPYVMANAPLSMRDLGQLAPTNNEDGVLQVIENYLSTYWKTKRIIMKIEHLAIYVNNLEGAREFFQTYFQAFANQLYHNQKTGFKSYFLSFQDGARLEIMTKPDMLDLPKEANRTGLAHFAMSLGSKEAIDALIQRLDAGDYKCINGPRTTGDGYYESVILGFEDNTIELTVWGGTFDLILYLYNDWAGLFMVGFLGRVIVSEFKRILEVKVFRKFYNISETKVLMTDR